MSIPKKNAKWMMYSSMGLELGLSVVVGLLIGSWMDEWLDSEPWFLLVFGISGIIAGYRSIYRLVKKVENDQEQETNQSSENQ